MNYGASLFNLELAKKSKKEPKPDQVLVGCVSRIS
jgi:hypothetical protein